MLAPYKTDKTYLFCMAEMLLAVLFLNKASTATPCLLCTYIFFASIGA